MLTLPLALRPYFFDRLMSCGRRREVSAAALIVSVMFSPRAMRQWDVLPKDLVLALAHGEQCSTAVVWLVLQGTGWEVE